MMRVVRARFAQFDRVALVSNWLMSGTAGISPTTITIGEIGGANVIRTHVRAGSTDPSGVQTRVRASAISERCFSRQVPAKHTLT